MIEYKHIMVTIPVILYFVCLVILVFMTIRKKKDDRVV